MNYTFRIPLLTAAFVVLTMGIGCSTGTTEPAMPNIILILADDLGYTQVGFNGSNYYQTPNLDKLASEGMRFTDAYAACAVCSPTRASIMTGKYPARLHLTDFIAGNDRKDKPLLQPQWQKFLPLEEVTIAEMLREAGYTTASFGKWHLSQEKMPPGSLPYNPDKQGFDESFVTYKPSGGMIQPWQEAENDAHNVDTITSLALDFLERNKSNPFFLYVPHNTIHNPLKEKAESIQKFEGLAETEAPENNPIIGAMIERLDSSCGEIFNKVSELGLEENTIIIFFSDNGGLEKDADQTPLRAGKGWYYEGGIREPLIVKWKNVVEPGSVSASLISSIDFFPTLLEIVGIDALPEDLDGISFAPVLKDPLAETHRELFWHYPHYHGSGMVPGAAMRSGKWKLVEWYEKSLLGERDSAFELYDLENDISESNNLADSLVTMTEQLSGELAKWREEVNAQMPTPNLNYTDQENN